MSKTEDRTGLTVDSTDEEYVRTCKAMQTYGGHFASHLAEAMMYADQTNRRRIIEAFPEIMVKYGPGSMFYEEMPPRVKRHNPTINAGDFGSGVTEV